MFLPAFSPCAEAVKQNGTALVLEAAGALCTEAAKQIVLALILPRALGEISSCRTGPTRRGRGG